MSGLMLHYGATLCAGVSFGAFLGFWRRDQRVRCDFVALVWLWAAIGWTLATFAIPVGATSP